jgi:hypothetical protein
MNELLNGNGDSIFTIKSHISQVVAIAATDDDPTSYRIEIVRNTVKKAIPGKDDYNPVEVVGRGKLT